MSTYVTVKPNGNMNPCGRTVCNFNDWRQRVTTVVSRTATRGKCRRCPWAQSCQKRSQTTDAKHDPVSEKPRLSALDLAQKIRDSATKKATQPPLSTQQKRVLDIKRFSTQLQNVHPNVLAKHLHRSVLYQDNDVVVINKPYGVPVRDDTGVTSISSVLPVLSKMMTGNKIKSDFNLLPCLRLEKEASGASPAGQEGRSSGTSARPSKKITKVITVGVPVPSVGIIDIPIIEREVTGPQPHYKMALSPLFKMNDSGDGLTKIRAHRQAHPAVTKYKVLDSSSGCSLVELQPCTGVKHQMRVHMAFGLTCPILGDHKYSHWNKLAPQKLPERVLKKLGLEQSKSRHLPLHLFARRLTLPGVNQANVSVSCPAPKYFTQTSNLLQLMLPFKEERH